MASNGPLQVVIGGDYVEAERAFSPATARFRPSRALMPTACAAGGCSSFTPIGRFDRASKSDAPRSATNDSDLTLNAPWLGNARHNRPIRPVRPTSTTSERADRFNFAPYNYPADPAGALRRLRQLEVRHYAPTINFSLKGVWNGASRRIRPLRCRLASGRTQASRRSARRHHRSTSPTRSTRSE